MAPCEHCALAPGWHQVNGVGLCDPCWRVWQAEVVECRVASARRWRQETAIEQVIHQDVEQGAMLIGLVVMALTSAAVTSLIWWLAC